MTADASRPDPLTPTDCDLRGLAYMALDVLRLRDSDLALLSSGDAFKGAVLLWSASWHQQPAGSVPNDERVLQRLSGLEPGAWKRAREMAMRGWVECSDGRLYHPVVAEKAIEAWGRRLKYQERREADRDRLRDWRGRKHASSPQGNATETPDETRFETLKKGKGKESSSSEDKSSAVASAAVIDPGKGAWRMAKAILRERSGLSEDAASKFFGKLLSTHSLDARQLFPALASAAANETQDPKAYLAKAASEIARRRADPQAAADRAMRSNIQ